MDIKINKTNSLHIDYKLYLYFFSLSSRNVARAYPFYILPRDVALQYDFSDNILQSSSNL